jgi:hypothetical protein
MAAVMATMAVSSELGVAITGMADRMRQAMQSDFMGTVYSGSR